MRANGRAGRRVGAGGAPGYRPLPLPDGCRRAASVSVLLDELHESHRRSIAGTDAQLEDAGVAAGPLLVARSHLVEELRDDLTIAQAIEGETTARDAVRLCEGDQGLDLAPQLLCLRQGRADRLVTQQRRRHVPEHRVPVRAVAAQLPAAVAMT